MILATGGRSLPKSGSDGFGYELARNLGHTIVPTTPALVPLLLDQADRYSINRDVSGVSHDVELAVWVDGRVTIRLTGPLLWTHFGISGPVALNASRHWLRAEIEKRLVRLTASFCPGATFAAQEGWWASMSAARPKASVLSVLSSRVPAAVAAALIRSVNVDPARQLAHLTRAERRTLTTALVEWPLAVTGCRGWNYAEATAGGVALDEIDPATMASRRCRGLYLVGEILDVDGRIGGFNFQWAWSSGYVAGRALGAAPVS
jgi:predicted Rossmann fold flavoprotein